MRAGKENNEEVGGQGAKSSVGEIASYIGELSTDKNLKITYFTIKQYLLDLSAV